MTHNVPTTVTGSIKCINSFCLPASWYSYAMYSVKWPTKCDSYWVMCKQYCGIPSVVMNFQFSEAICLVDVYVKPYAMEPLSKCLPRPIGIGHQLGGHNLARWTAGIRLPYLVWSFRDLLNIGMFNVCMSKTNQLYCGWTTFDKQFSVPPRLLISSNVLWLIVFGF